MMNNQSQCEYLCSKCDFSATNKKDYKRHLISQKHICQNDGYICNMCSKLYKTRSGLWKHKKTYHKETDLIKSDKTENKIDKLEKEILDIQNKCNYFVPQFIVDEWRKHKQNFPESEDQVVLNIEPRNTTV